MGKPQETCGKYGKTCRKTMGKPTCSLESPGFGAKKMGLNVGKPRKTRGKMLENQGKLWGNRGKPMETSGKKRGKPGTPYGNGSSGTWVHLKR